MACQILGVARSHIAALAVRSAGWTDGRKARTSNADADVALVDAVRAEIGSCRPMFIGALEPWSIVAAWQRDCRRLTTSGSTAS
jgi:transposase